MQPVEMTSEEITERLARADSAPLDRIEAVLSAVFYGDSVEFAGDILINEFATADYIERSNLKNAFETFYQMNETDYRIDDSISILLQYSHASSDAEVDSIIDTLSELKSIFRA